MEPRPVQGMRHFPGGGPDGATCRECRFFDGPRYLSGGVHGTCREAKRIAGLAVPFYRGTPACRYFEPHEATPAPIAPPPVKSRARSIPIDHTKGPVLARIDGELKPVDLPPEVREFYRAWYAEMGAHTRNPDSGLLFSPSSRLARAVWPEDHKRGGR